jgi:hypothetical protein
MDYFERKIATGLEERTDGRVEEVSISACTSLTTAEIARSDVLELGHLSLGRNNSPEGEA